MKYLWSNSNSVLQLSNLSIMQGDARYVTCCMYSNPPWFFTTGIANIGGNICASDSHFFLRSFLSHATMCLLFLCFSLEERNTGPSFKKKQTCRQASDLRNIFQRPLWVVSAFSEFDSKYNLFARQLAALGFQFLAEICSKWNQLYSKCARNGMCIIWNVHKQKIVFKSVCTQSKMW